MAPPTGHVGIYTRLPPLELEVSEEVHGKNNKYITYQNVLLYFCIHTGAFKANIKILYSTIKYNLPSIGCSCDYMHVKLTSPCINRPHFYAYEMITKLLYIKLIHLQSKKKSPNN